MGGQWRYAREYVVRGRLRVRRSQRHARLSRHGPVDAAGEAEVARRSTSIACATDSPFSTTCSRAAGFPPTPMCARRARERQRWDVEWRPQPGVRFDVEGYGRLTHQRARSVRSRAAEGGTRWPRHLVRCLARAVCRCRWTSARFRSNGRTDSGPMDRVDVLQRRPERAVQPGAGRRAVPTCRAEHPASDSHHRQSPDGPCRSRRERRSAQR